MSQKDPLDQLAWAIALKDWDAASRALRRVKEGYSGSPGRWLW